MNARLWWIAVGLAPVILVFAARADGPVALARPNSYASDNATAMDRMMAAMAVPPTGDTDRDFVATMVPHHQGAIDMAVAELRYGKDETLRRMAQEIIVEQQQEIAAMELAAERLPTPPGDTPASTAICTSKSMSQPTHAHLVHGDH